MFQYSIVQIISHECSCRLFSKFYSRKMQELNEAGLNNVTVLFVVLAHVTDLQDTVCST